MPHPRSRRCLEVESGLSSRLYTASDNSVKHLVVNCRAWVNDKRRVRNNNGSRRVKEAGKRIRINNII